MVIRSRYLLAAALGLCAAHLMPAQEPGRLGLDRVPALPAATANQQLANAIARQLLKPEVLQRVVLLRRTLVQMKPVEAMEQLVRQLGKYPSNAAFLERIGGFAK